MGRLLIGLGAAAVIALAGSAPAGADSTDDAFLASHTLQDAVLRNLQTLAESTQRLSPAAKAAAPSVDWVALSGFRNVLVHNYLGIDLDRIWTIVEQDVPTLKAALGELPG